MPPTPVTATDLPPEPTFSEETYYLHKFRGRTMGVAIPPELLDAPAPLLGVIGTLMQHGCRVLILSTERAVLASLGAVVIDPTVPRFEAHTWRTLRIHGFAAIHAPDTDLDELALDAARRLRLFKVVRVEDRGVEEALPRGSFVHLQQLEDNLQYARDALDTPQERILEGVRALLQAGVSEVNTCSLEGLRRELLSYAGSGTLFTRERHVHVEPLGIEDFDAAESLIRQGEADGYLAPRTPAAIDELLCHTFGAFLERDHLVGIGALRLMADGTIGELCSLVTTTRFLGEGVGPYLVDFALARARTLGLEMLFACTTSARVGDFFQRQGFGPIEPEELPAEKWEGYDPERRKLIRCFAFPPARR